MLEVKLNQQTIAFFAVLISVKQGKVSLVIFKALIKYCRAKTNLHWLAYFFKPTLHAALIIMHSYSTRQSNLFHLQEDSMGRSLTELEIMLLSMAHSLNVFLLSYLHLSCYIPSVRNFLHLVLLVVCFFVIIFLISWVLLVHHENLRFYHIYFVE